MYIFAFSRCLWYPFSMFFSPFFPHVFFQRCCGGIRLQVFWILTPSLQTPKTHQAKGDGPLKKGGFEADFLSFPPELAHRIRWSREELKFSKPFLPPKNSDTMILNVGFETLRCPSPTHWTVALYQWEVDMALLSYIIRICLKRCLWPLGIIRTYKSIGKVSFWGETKSSATLRCGLIQWPKPKKML